jgi:hypothetical protein
VIERRHRRRELKINEEIKIERGDHMKKHRKGTVGRTRDKQRQIYLKYSLACVVIWRHLE